MKTSSERTLAVPRGTSPRTTVNLRRNFDDTSGSWLGGDHVTVWSGQAIGISDWDAARIDVQLLALLKSSQRKEIEMISAGSRMNHSGLRYVRKLPQLARSPSAANPSGHPVSRRIADARCVLGADSGRGVRSLRSICTVVAERRPLRRKAFPGPRSLPSSGRHKGGRILDAGASTHGDNLAIEAQRRRLRRKAFPEPRLRTSSGHLEDRHSIGRASLALPRG